MNHDSDIRAALKRRLENVSSDSTIPGDTLRRSRRRRRGVIATSALGGLGSAILILVGLQVMEAPNARPDVVPASTPSGEETPTKEPSESSPVREHPGAPPPVTVRSEGETIELPAWSYCYKDRCVSGSPGPNPPDVGSAEEIVVDFPVRGWTFTAMFTPTGEKCGRQQQVSVEPAEDGGFLLRPVGHAGTYDVTLFGTGDGSLSATFRWTTTTDGPLPRPEARAAIVTDQDGASHSYGVELEIVNLPETPTEATATITVEAANGRDVTFEAERAHGRCFPEGTVYWDGPDASGREAAQLGEAPFDYTVDVNLDGRRYVGTGTWPRDEIRGNEPSIGLEFRPELPRPR